MYKKLKIYNKITYFGLIARRYFINNFYDGMLTILGILLGFFMFIIYNSEINTIESILIIFPSIGTSVSMFISGVSGSYLSERAEQRMEKRKLDRAMVILEDENLEELNRSSILNYKEEIQKAMVTPISINSALSYSTTDKKRKTLKRKNRSIHEKAEKFANFFVSFTNGTAPLLGGIIPSLPFFFVQNAGMPTFIISFVTIFVCIVFLGVILGAISKESIIKNILQMTAAFIATFLVSFLLLRV